MSPAQTPASAATATPRPVDLPLISAPFISVPFISVIVPTFNRADIVEITLEHLLAQEYPADRFEILVVDNSSDATPAMVERVAATARADIRLVRLEERLPAVKRNRGLELARGDLALFINDDVWFVPETFAEHARSHAAHAEPIAVLGHVYQSPRMPATPFVERYEPFAYGEIADRADRSVAWRYHWSMNLSLPRQVMLERNLAFHEDWANIGHEDVELGYRWSRAGYQIVYNPRATGEHFHPHTVASARRLQESVGRGLRDLEVLIPEPGLHERYGILRPSNSARAIARGLVREALFNGYTAPRIARWLDSRSEGSALQDWLYWKVLLQATNHGYRTAPTRSPRPLATAAPHPIEVSA